MVRRAAGHRRGQGRGPRPARPDQRAAGQPDELQPGVERPRGGLPLGGREPRLRQLAGPVLVEHRDPAAPLLRADADRAAGQPRLLAQQLAAPLQRRRRHHPHRGPRGRQRDPQRDALVRDLLLALLERARQSVPALHARGHHRQLQLVPVQEPQPLFGGQQRRQVRHGQLPHRAPQAPVDRAPAEQGALLPVAGARLLELRGHQQPQRSPSTGWAPSATPCGCAAT